MTPIGARRRQPRPPGQNSPLKIMTGLLQYRQDANGEDLARGLIVGNIDDNETSTAMATSTVRIPIPGSVQLVANYTELYPSDGWLDPSTYVQSTETISEACSGALIDHDYTYYMDEADKKWLDDRNHGCCVEEPIVHERRAGCTLVLISADEFELVMGLFEILTGPKLRSQHQLSDFSFFQPFFQAPLHPDTFASHVVPAWVPPPSVLTSIALIIYPHWQQRRSLRGGHKIFPLLNNDERDCINAAYVCFRNTLVHRMRSQSLKAGGHAQIGGLRMDFFDQRLANKHERLTKGSPKPRLQSNPHIQTRTEKEPAYATEGITISPPSIKEKTEQNGNANHNSLKTTSSIPQPVIQSENVKQRLISATTEQKRPEKLRMERGTPSSTSVVRPQQGQPRAPQLPSMASSVVPEHQRSAYPKNWLILGSSHFSQAQNSEKKTILFNATYNTLYNTRPPPPRMDGDGLEYTLGAPRRVASSRSALTEFIELMQMRGKPHPINAMSEGGIYAEKRSQSGPAALSWWNGIGVG
ncbi:hypothetical protein B0H13DRAFT_1898810 [Mycena leptocephala]|nr:hypothetical protein B0H13DRAFT_1898810 [Mycena leptocephala]